MKNLIKKCAVFIPLFLLMGTHHVYGAKSINATCTPMQKVDDAARVPSTKRKLFVGGYCRAYHVPADLCFFIRCLVYDNPFKYRNKPLPSDLSGQDLSGFDFTGCDFTHTNLTYTNLVGVILANTTCNYQKAFQDNIKENKIYGGDWYQKNLLKDLKSIAQVYTKLENDTHKAKLLEIAAGLAWLPFYEKKEFYIKLEYWSCELLQLKQVLGNPYVHQLICSLEDDLNDDANNCCWKTKFLQHKVNIVTQASHANFDKYLQDFTDGLKTHGCNSACSWAFDYYKRQIAKNIEGLKKTYPKIKEKQLQQATCNIANALSKSYEFSQMVFQHHYLFFQHRLMRLKKSVDIGVGNEVYYSSKPLKSCPDSSWRRGRK